MNNTVNNATPTGAAESIAKAQEKYDEVVKANEPATLEMEPLELPVHTQGYITNTIKLAKLVSELFAIFKDYDGCRIYSYMGPNAPEKLEPNATKFMSLGNLYVDLFFSKNSNSAALGIDNLELAGAANSSASMLERVRNVCGTAMHRTYNVTKDTTDILKNYLPGFGLPNFDPAWNSRIVEINNQQPYSSSVIVKIAGLSLDAIMGTIYGLYTSEEEKANDKNGRNPHYDYHCVVLANSMAGMNPMMYNRPMNEQHYVIQVLRNDRSIIDATREAIGMTPMTQANGYIPFVRNA